MSAVDQTRTGHRPGTRTGARTAAEIRPVPFSRLTLVEWRKQLDTRAVRWLFVTIALLTAGVVTVTALVGEGDVSFETFVSNTSTPLAMLLPIVAILATTAEWSQRTALTTFTLEPRRGRVVGAKLLTAVGSGLAFFVVAVGIAAVAHLGVVTLRDASPDWGLGAMTAGMALMIVLWMVQGVAFGLALQSTPAAIVVFLAVPTIVGAITMLLTAWSDVWPWLDLSTSSVPLIMGEPLGGTGWAQLATSAAIWVGLPLAVGVRRVQRGEVKTS
ncbi:ABC transporter permease [Isoptericola sp. AK164]|uniref:ABC transporter permease n=1 Tax=Isoptericola sp. AK164 TaxID=3024246 RepID=UPI00241852F5|nr:ABC transporter permease [Isoptericola sp. AK164]